MDRRRPVPVSVVPRAKGVCGVPLLFAHECVWSLTCFLPATSPPTAFVVATSLSCEAVVDCGWCDRHAEKHIIMHYEFLGQTRDILTQERHKCLVLPIQIVAPIAMPALVIRAAFFRHANGEDVYDVCDPIRACRFACCCTAACRSLLIGWAVSMLV